MYLDLKYDDERFTGLTICPSEKENPDLLHDYAQSLVLKNPALNFAEMAKNGVFNDMDDDDYQHALEMIKTVSLFFNKKSEENIFHVLAEAIDYILSTKRTIDDEDEKSEPEDEMSDEWDAVDLEWDFIDDDDDGGSDDT